MFFYIIILEITRYTTRYYIIGNLRQFTTIYNILQYLEDS